MALPAAAATAQHFNGMIGCGMGEDDSVAMLKLLERMSGLSWLSALAVATLLNLVITGVAVWRASRFFDYMGLHATRRQLSRLGLFDEHGEDVDDPAATAAPPAGEPRA